MKIIIFSSLNISKVIKFIKYATNEKPQGLGSRYIFISFHSIPFNSFIQIFILFTFLLLLILIIVAVFFIGLYPLFLTTMVTNWNWIYMNSNHWNTNAFTHTHSHTHTHTPDIWTETKGFSNECKLRREREREKKIEKNFSLRFFLHTYIFWEKTRGAKGSLNQSLTTNMTYSLLHQRKKKSINIRILSFTFGIHNCWY